MGDRFTVDGADVPIPYSWNEGRIYKLGTIHLPAGLIGDTELDRGDNATPRATREPLERRGGPMGLGRHLPNYKAKGYLDLPWLPRGRCLKRPPAV